jgi:subtilisin family serine protease
MKRLSVLSLLALVAACGEPPTTAGPLEVDMPTAFSTVEGVQATSRIVVLEDDVSPTDVAAAIETAGGTVEVIYPFGVVIASGGDVSAGIEGVESATIDMGFDVSGNAFTGEALNVEAISYPPNSGNDDFFFDLQWGHNYVGAQESWAEGYRGQGVRVAVLDGGMDLDHPDLAPNLNLALSQDFTGEGLQYGLPNTFSHASHVAGTIAAADNAFGTIGVAPDAELVAVKVLSDAGSGSFANIIAGVYYAASVDADVMNLSLGTIIPRSIDADAISALAVATSRAVLWAKQQGTLVVVSGGNAAADLDGDGDNVRFLTGMPGTTGISALTPLNWASNPGQSLVPAGYTNYGTSMIDFSAPGGSVDYPGNEGCVVAGLARPCWVFDLVFSTGNGGWYWSAGTSMAAPHAAGVAALIISENGGDMDPAAVEREMRRRAEQMAKGRDDFFGHGLVNSGY